MSESTNQDNGSFRKLLANGWLIALLALPFLRGGHALDTHWSLSWVVGAALIIGGVILRLITISSHVVWLAIGWILITVIQMRYGFHYTNEDAMLACFLMLMLAVKPTWELVKCKSIVFVLTSLWCLFSLVLVFLLANNVSAAGYTHEGTYAVKPLFAHRNIAIESYALWSTALVALLHYSRWRWLVLCVALLLITVYQVRTAFLGVGLLLVVELWLSFYSRRWFKWVVGLGLLLVVASQVVFVVLRQPQYKPKFDALPDLVKNFDAVYNVNRAESSSERLIMWQWTTENLTWLGTGCGNWKFEAEGYVNARLGKCDLVVRHPHADVLKMAFEMGVIGCLLFFAWLFFFVRPAWRYFIVFVPMFLFAFPTERAETLSSLMVLLLFSRRELSVPTKMSFVALLPLVALFFAAFMWNRSQNVFGKAMRDPLLLKYASPMERTALDAFPFDIVLNRLPTYQAIVLADGDRPAEAKVLLKDVLAKHPNDQGAIRLLERLGGELPANVHRCINEKEPEP